MSTTRRDAREWARRCPGDLSDGRGEGAPPDGEATGCNAGIGVALRVARTMRGVLSRPRKGAGVVRLGAASASADDAVAEVTSMADEATSATTRPQTSARSEPAACPSRRQRLPEGARRGRAEAAARPPPSQRGEGTTPTPSSARDTTTALETQQHYICLKLEILLSASPSLYRSHPLVEILSAQCFSLLKNHFLLRLKTTLGNSSKSSYQQIAFIPVRLGRQQFLNLVGVLS